MTAAARPPFDPELALFLATMEERGRFTLTTEMLPRMRQLEITEEELEDNLRTRGLERQTFTVPGHNGDPIQLAVIQRTGRTGTAPCFYTMHGGGMMFGHHLGNLDSYDDWLLTHDVVLVSVDYRLAPEHPDPYPVEDCYAGLLWTVAHADELGVDPARVVLVGQSAGGGLAAGTALLARDRQGPEILAQILVSPMLDDTDSTVSTHQIDGVGVADRSLTRFGWTAYLGDRRGGEDVWSTQPQRGRRTSRACRRPISTARAPRCSATRRWRTRAVSGRPGSRPSSTSGPGASTASRAWCRRRH